MAIVAGVVGIVGSIVPGIPGPPVGWAGLLLLYLGGGANAAGQPLSLALLLVMLAVVVVVSVLDYVVPGRFTRRTGGSPYASRGATAGLIVGCFFTPIGMIPGCFLGALLSEMYWGGKPFREALNASLGAFLGLLAGTGLKLLCSGVLIWLILAYCR